MTDPAPPLPERLTFTYRAGEARRFRDLAGRSLNRMLPWTWVWIVIFAMVFVIGLAVLAVQQSGIISVAEIKPVLFTAYVAFGAGARLVIWLWARRNREIARASTDVFEGRALIWEVEFSESGIACKTELFDTRIPWRAVKSVESWRDCVMIWLVYFNSIAIPARIFADDAAPAAFVAAVRARIELAHSSERAKQA
jgi:hypothetical protein